MIDWRDPDGRPRRDRTALSTARWTLAAVVVVAAHGAGAWAALNWRVAEAMPNEPPPTVQIDLAPLAVAPPAPLQDVAPGPQMTEAQPDPTPETQEPVADKPDPTPPTPVATQEPVKPDPTPVAKTQPDLPVPPLPEKDKAEAVLAPPPPKVHKRPPPKTHEAERKKPIHPKKRKQLRTSAPPSTRAAHADAAAAPSAGSDASPSVSPATWKSELMAHLNRYKRYPAGASGAGTASVLFTVTRSGRVLSSRLIGSSGDAALDAEAVSLPRRASPVPAPPPNIGRGGSLTLTVPIRFGR
jgi:protein TonB